MRYGIRLVLVLFALSGNIVVSHGADAPSREQMRNSLRKSLTYLEKKGVEWIEQRKCVSCHRVAFLVWSFNAAERIGLQPSPKRLPTWTAWSADWKHWMQPGRTGTEDDVAGRNVDTMAQLILAWQQRGEVAPVPEWVARFRKHLLRVQQPDGSWKPGGQLPLQRRSARETTEVTTLWTLLALGNRTTDNRIEEARKKALAWLRRGPSGKSTEWWAARLLVAHYLGNKRNAQSLRKSLRKHQNPDGGWGWLVGEKSDAFGTGLALFALARTDPDDAQMPRKRAQRFLISTQRKDGSWTAPSTRRKDKLQVKETSIYWGTAWASIALAESLSPPPKRAADARTP